jgi:hypothetical protein
MLQVAAPGRKPELKWIKLSQLYVPSEYQRSIRSDASARNIGHMKNHFSWAECGALIVCPLAGSEPPQYAVIDGQHRLRAAEAHGGIDELPCVVIPERETEAQAGNFVAINSRRVSLHPLQRYKAAVVAGDPDAVALASILEMSRVVMAAHAFPNSETPPRVTQAVGTLLKMMQDFSEKQIVWALTIIPEAYGDENGMLRASLIRALAWYIKSRPDTDRERMVSALRDIDVEQLEKDARAYRAIEGGTMKDAIIRVLEKKYNAARKAA